MADTRERARLEILWYVTQFALTSVYSDSRHYGGLHGFVHDKKVQKGDLIAIQSSPVSKWYLSWLVETREKTPGYTEYLLESIEDGSLCWWSNVGITYFERDSVGPHWRWTDRQYAFKDRWWNVCYKQRDAYMTVPVFPEFGEGFSVTLGTRTRHGFDDHRPTKTFPDWRKVTKAQMLAFFDECVASRPSRPTPPFIGEAKE